MDGLVDLLFVYVNNAAARSSYLPPGVGGVLKRLPRETAEQLVGHVVGWLEDGGPRWNTVMVLNQGRVCALFTALVQAHPDMRLAAEDIMSVLAASSEAQQKLLVNALPVATARQLALAAPDDHPLAGYIARRAKKLMKENSELDPNHEDDARIIERARPKKKGVSTIEQALPKMKVAN